MIRHVMTAAAFVGALAASAAHADAPAKNWSAPAYRIYAQQLSDETMQANPDLLSVTFHGIPPGAVGETFTMYAGSYPDRIGNPDDPDDIDVSKKGITIVDPRWHRTKDPAPKFVVLMPLRDASMNNIGLIVYAFKVPVESNAGERAFYARALDLRDALARQIPSYEALFAPAK
ncbi:MAG TPA: hypothetical protein VFF98_16730 [Novosphingobium sp.]|nr:hypothetical protein [Novosphingobium sp.]HZV09578.1 hypothetical protein [Novosphingobium sp.]